MPKCERCGIKLGITDGLYGSIITKNGKVVFDCVCVKCGVEFNVAKKGFKSEVVKLIGKKQGLSWEERDKFNTQFNQIKKQKHSAGWKWDCTLIAYESLANEIKESETVLAFTIRKVVPEVRYPSFGSSHVLVTNKRIMIRNIRYLGKEQIYKDKDIFFDEIDKDSIRTEDKFVIFKQDNEEHMLVNTKSRKLLDILKERIEEGTVVNKTEFVKKEQEEKGEQIKEKMLDAIAFLYHVDGIPFLGGKEVKFELYEDRLNILDFEEMKPYKITLENILDIKTKKEGEISEKERHTILRAIGGGILLGPLGAIIGGMSGVPHKLEKTENVFLTLDYKSKDGEKKSLIFVQEPKAIFNSPGLQGFLDTAIKHISITSSLEKDEDGEVEL